MLKVSAVAAAVLMCCGSMASAVVVEDADWESSSIPSQWILSYSHAAETAEPVVLQPSDVSVDHSDYPPFACSGRYALEFQLTYREDRSGFRNELTLVGPNKEWDYGVDFWLGWAIYLPDSYVVDSRGDTLLQFHGVPDRDSSGNRLEPNRHPPIAIKTAASGNWLMHVKGDSRKISSSTGASTRATQYEFGRFDADRGKWTEFVMHVRFSYDSNGVVELWKDGTQVVSDRGENTFNDDVPPYLKIGIYKPAWKPNDWGGPTLVPFRRFYYDAVKVARNGSFAEAAPDCNGSATIPTPPVLAD